MMSPPLISPIFLTVRDIKIRWILIILIRHRIAEWKVFQSREISYQIRSGASNHYFSLSKWMMEPESWTVTKENKSEKWTVASASFPKQMRSLTSKIPAEFQLETDKSTLPDPKWTNTNKKVIGKIQKINKVPEIKRLQHLCPNMTSQLRIHKHQAFYPSMA